MAKLAETDFSTLKNQFYEDCDALRKCEISEEKISALVNLWENYLRDADQNLECLLMCTAQTVFNVDYSKKISPTSHKKLKGVIISCANNTHGSISRQKLLNGIGSIIENPWQPASYFHDAVIGPKSKRENAFNMLWDTEGWIMLESRIDYLSKNCIKCFDQLCSILDLLVEKGHTIFRKNGSKPISFHPYEFPYHKYIEYLEVYALLLFNNLFDTQIIDALKPRVLFEVVSNLVKKAADPNSSRLFPKLEEWTDAMKAGIYFAKIATLHMLKLPNASLLKEFFSIWIKTSELEFLFNEIIKQEIFDTENLYQIAKFTIQLLGDTPFSRVKYLQLFIIAMTTDLTLIEAMKRTQRDKGATIREHEERLAIRYLDLVRFFKNYKKTAKDCLITAFSLDPCQKLFTFLFPSDLGQSNYVAMSDGDNSYVISVEYDDIQDLGLDKECDMNREDDLGLGEDLTDDLATLIYNPRYKGFLKINSNEELKKVCLKLLKCKSVAVIENRRLEYAKIDFSRYSDFEMGSTIAGKRKYKLAKRKLIIGILRKARKIVLLRARKQNKFETVFLSTTPWFPKCPCGGFCDDFIDKCIRVNEPPYKLQSHGRDWNFTENLLKSVEKKIPFEAGTFDSMHNVILKCKVENSL